MSSHSRPQPAGCLPPHWRDVFMAMLPGIERYLRKAFGTLKGDTRAEAIQEGIVHALVAFRRLCERGKLELAYPTVLARYAVAQFRDGREVATRMNVKDVLSPRCQNHKGVRVDRLGRYDSDNDCWEEIVVEDRKAGPAEIAATRIDFREFMQSLSERERQIANTLAGGESNLDAAKCFGVSSARISQIRRELWGKWRAFHGEPPEVIGAVEAAA